MPFRTTWVRGCAGLLAAVMALGACATPEPMFERNGVLKGLLFGSNAREHRMAEGIYQLVVADSRDAGEINPMHMMMYFAAELSLEKGYAAFVMLPHDERPYLDAQIKKLRKRVYAGEFDETVKRPKIKVRTTHRCSSGGVCSTTYKSKAIIVMLTPDEARTVRSLDARQVYARFKEFVPTPEDRKKAQST